jgi:hypothetical protein
MVEGQKERKAGGVGKWRRYAHTFWEHSFKLICYKIQSTLRDINGIILVIYFNFRFNCKDTKNDSTCFSIITERRKFNKYKIIKIKIHYKRNRRDPRGVHDNV